MEKLAELRRRLIKVNRIYIMPSGRGTLFLGVVVVMILTAASYNNNLIFILAFFLFALFVVSMLQTHYVMKGVRADYVGSDDAFEGESLTLLFHLTQKRARLKRGLELRTASKEFVTIDRPRETIQPDENKHPVRLKVMAARRGVHAVPTIILESYFPLGLFRAWKVFRPEGLMRVYPKPVGARALSTPEATAGDDATGLRTTPDGDFGELKAYQIGESYHQIAWKHFARTGNLYSKVHWGSAQKHYSIRWQPPSGTDEFETYLRQISRWILNALEEDASFELETPRFKIETGRGPDHAVACWRALAEIGNAA